MTIRHSIIPSPGNIAVVRERIEEKTSGGIIRPDEIQSDLQRINPWALVVGVGPPRPTQYGTTISTNVEPGDKVLISQSGRYVDLDAGNGEIEYLYVLPFEGVLATLRYTCSLCHEAWEDDPAGICPNGCVDLARPTLAQTLAAKGPH